ncbi:VOC family protein [Streptomyces sp. Y7]|uniref:VOC family protein n=1 Tax=Streptomyces sp. Y7 TaxID=3342392 RepID=UPI0037201E28
MTATMPMMAISGGEAMTGLLDVDRLHSVGVVVRDLEAATLRYAEIFGIDEWDVHDYGPDRLTDVNSHGRPTTPTFRTATGTTVPPSGQAIAMRDGVAVPVTFELVQPLKGESPFQEFRFARGQGISHLTLAVHDAAEFGVLRDRLEKKGIPIAASMTVDGLLERHFLDTRAALGGYLIEVRVPRQRDAGDERVVTEHWNHSGRYTRPAGVGPVKVEGVNHFGVVVNDVMKSIEQYNDLLGMGRWDIRTWRPELGLLEGAYYRDEPVNHEYFTGLAPMQDFGFEIIQPTLGPSHYNREFRDLLGEGVHHMLLNVTTDVGEWNSVRDWLKSIDVPVAMGADLLKGAAHFCYYDTSEALGGYILEAVLMKDHPDESVASPDFVIDFATLASGG